MSTGPKKVIFGASENFTYSPKIGIFLGGWWELKIFGAPRFQFICKIIRIGQTTGLQLSPLQNCGQLQFTSRLALTGCQQF